MNSNSNSNPDKPITSESKNDVEGTSAIHKAAPSLIDLKEIACRMPSIIVDDLRDLCIPRVFYPSCPDEDEVYCANLAKSVFKMEAPEWDANLFPDPVESQAPRKDFIRLIGIRVFDRFFHVNCGLLKELRGNFDLAKAFNKFSDIRMEQAAGDLSWDHLNNQIRFWRPDLIIFEITPETPEAMFGLIKTTARRVCSLLMIVISQQHAIIIRKETRRLYRLADIVTILSDSSKRGVDCAFVFYNKRIDRHIGCRATDEAKSDFGKIREKLLLMENRYYRRQCKQILDTRNQVVKRLNKRLGNPCPLFKTPENGAMMLSSTDLQITGPLFALFLSRINILVSFRGQPFRASARPERECQNVVIDISNIMDSSRCNHHRLAKRIVNLVFESIFVFKPLCELHGPEELEKLLKDKKYHENDIEMNVCIFLMIKFRN